MAAFLLTLTRTNWLNFSAQSWGGTLSGSRFLSVNKDILVWILLFFQSTIGWNCLFVKTAWKNTSFMGREGGYSSSHHQRAVFNPLSFSIILLSALDVQLCPRDRSLFSLCVRMCVCGLWQLRCELLFYTLALPLYGNLSTSSDPPLQN